MQMMYDVVAKELKSMELKDSHPLDYLNFYCLGNREGVTKEMSKEAGSTPANAETVISMLNLVSAGLVYCAFKLMLHDYLVMTLNYLRIILVYFFLF